MPARKTDTEPTVADLVAKGDIEGIEKLIENAAAGIGDAELISHIQSLEAQLVAVEEERRRLNPLAAWPVWETADDVIGHLGEDRVLEMAMEEIRAANRDAVTKHRAPIFTSEDQHVAMAKALIPKLAKAMVAEQTKWTKADTRNKPIPMRTFKMIAPAHNCDRHDEPVSLCYDHGSMRQIPVELQINNGAASLNDPIERYKRKGFKPADPSRCKLLDCYRPSAVTDDGRWRYARYCSVEHQEYVEGGDRRRDRLGHDHDIQVHDVVLRA